jgi:hypothetical protein
MPFVATEPRCTGTTTTGIPCARPAGHPTTGPNHGHRGPRTRAVANDMPTARVDVRSVDGGSFTHDAASATGAVIRVNDGPWFRIGDVLVGAIGDETIVAVTDTNGSRTYVSRGDRVTHAVPVFVIPGVDDPNDVADDTSDAPDDVTGDVADDAAYDTRNLVSPHAALVTP